MKKHRISKAAIVADLRRVARLLNHSPSTVEYDKLGRYHVRTIQRKYAASWTAIINSAGLCYAPRTSRRIPSTQELRCDLLRVARKLRYPPTRSDYQKYGEYGPETVRRRSRKKHWADAVAALSNLDPEEIKYRQQKGGCYRTTDEWLLKLHKLADRIGHAPTTREANNDGINPHQLRHRVGGNWTDVLIAAGIDIRNRSKHAILLSNTTERLIDDVIALSVRLGHPAKVWEYAKAGHYPYTTLRGRLGGWRKVKQIVSDRQHNKNNC